MNISFLFIATNHNDCSHWMKEGNPRIRANFYSKGNFLSNSKQIMFMSSDLTACPRSLGLFHDPFYIVSHYIKRVTILPGHTVYSLAKTF